LSPSTRYTLLAIIGASILGAGAFVVWLVVGDSPAIAVSPSELFHDPDRFAGQRISVTAYFDEDSCALVYPPDRDHSIMVDLPSWSVRPFVHGSGFFRVHGTIAILIPASLTWPHMTCITKITRFYPDPFSHLRLSHRRSNQTMQPTASPRTASLFDD